MRPELPIPRSGRPWWVARLHIRSTSDGVGSRWNVFTSTRWPSTRRSAVRSLRNFNLDYRGAQLPDHEAKVPSGFPPLEKSANGANSNTEERVDHGYQAAYARDVIERIPSDFLLGAATAAYQIEGAAHEDGRTPSIWDTFSHTPGRTGTATPATSQPTTTTATNPTSTSWRGSGSSAYRFSISWPRVQPGGRAGRTEGVEFYSPSRRRTARPRHPPVATLYHWDLPQALGRRRLADRDTAERFAEYAARTVEVLGDRVAMWTTLNEPWCSAFLGYGSGVHAPGSRDGRLRTGGGAPPQPRARGAVPEIRRAARNRRRGVDDPQLPCRAPGDDRARTPCAGSTASRTGRSPNRSCAGSTRRISSKTPTVSRGGGSCATATSPRSRLRSTFSASTTTRRSR